MITSPKPVVAAVELYKPCPRYRRSQVATSFDAHGPIVVTVKHQRRRSTRNEGHERRYFYGSVWAVANAQPVLWLLWKVVTVKHQRWRTDQWQLCPHIGIAQRLEHRLDCPRAGGGPQ